MLFLFAKLIRLPIKNSSIMPSSLVMSFVVVNLLCCCYVLYDLNMNAMLGFFCYDICFVQVFVRKIGRSEFIYYGFGGYGS